MTDYLVLVVGILYVIIGIGYVINRQTALGVVFISYAIANVGLFMVGR